MPNLVHLPDRVWFVIVTCLSLRDIGRFARVCKRFSRLIGQDDAWKPISKQLINIHEEKVEGVRQFRYINSKKVLRLKEKCRISNNWAKGHKKESNLYKFKTRYLPWIQLDRNHLYLSQGETIHRFQLTDNGGIRRKTPVVSYEGFLDDVTRFVIRNDKLLAGGSEGKLVLFNKITGAQVHSYRPVHELNHGMNFICVDMTDDVVIGGMNSQSITLWRLGDGECAATIPVEDKIWSVAANPSQRSFATGDAGITDEEPIKIWDIENGTPIMSVGAKWRHGAGILHMQYESPDTLLSCGHDTMVRMWDMRTDCASPVIELEDPHDYTVYCLHSDGKHLIASGTGLWGVARLWDKRMNKSLQSFFIGPKTNNPVYCLQINATHLYAALSNSLRALSFTMT